MTVLLRQWELMSNSAIPQSSSIRYSLWEACSTESWSGKNVMYIWDELWGKKPNKSALEERLERGEQVVLTEQEAEALEQQIPPCPFDLPTAIKIWNWLFEKQSEPDKPTPVERRKPEPYGGASPHWGS